MPVTDKFMSDGKGNGFPFCLGLANQNQEDVTLRSYWTTLSGWSKVNEPATDELKAASIAESRALAMEIFWNIVEVTGSLSTTSDIYASSALTTTGDYSTEPDERVCFENNLFYFSDYDGTKFTNYSEIGASIKIVSMYNGTEFVGYGISDNTINDAISADARSYGSGTSGYQQARAIVRLASAPSFAAAGPGTAYVQLGEFHFVCTAGALSNFGTGIVDAANLYAYSEGTDNNPSSPTIVSTATAQLTGLNFYTYPA